MSSRPLYPGQLPVVSAAVYGRILTSSRLRRLLLPEGLWRSPYEVLDYRATLILHDRYGLRATFARTQEVQFQQDGVGGILDHAWGDGVLLTDYRHSAGAIAESLRDGEYHHLVVRFAHPVARGARRRFHVERDVMAAFTGEREWLETVIDHPVRRLSCTIVFPPARPCRAAVLVSGRQQAVCPIERLADGRTQVRIAPRHPQAHRPYLLRWWW